MADPEPPKQEDDAQTERERRIANAALLVIFIVIVGAGIWLANAMFDQRIIDNCVAQGRRNCAPIDAPGR